MNSTIPRVLMGLAATVGSFGTCLQRGAGSINPVSPPAAVCVPGQWACRDGIPSRCDTDAAGAGTARWWPTTPRRQDGSHAACEGRCIVDSVAHCARQGDPT